jgi:hypothetical protein
MSSRLPVTQHKSCRVSVYFVLRAYDFAIHMYVTFRKGYGTASVSKKSLIMCTLQLSEDILALEHIGRKDLLRNIQKLYANGHLNYNQSCSTLTHIYNTIHGTCIVAPVPFFRANSAYYHHQQHRCINSNKIVTIRQWDTLPTFDIV